ncbi:MAG: SRPBCC family protein [Pseudomonadales bacterium]|nr:SRPBCC family protein [Pseudomonadales bacterium]
MTSVMIKREIKAPASEAWKLLADFGGICHIMKGIEADDITLEGEGLLAVRTINMPTGTVQERCEALDKDNMMLSYSILGQGPLPVSHYLSTVRVFELGPELCRVEWGGSFEADGSAPLEQVIPMIEGIYKSGIIGTQKRLGVFEKPA